MYTLLIWALRIVVVLWLIQITWFVYVLGRYLDERRKK